MSYKFFDKKYLVMPDDEDIIGKKVLYADYLYALIEEVESGDSSSAREIEDIVADCSSPFHIDGSRWGLAYYDPNYECKVAYSQGKQIQYRANDGKWEDTAGKPLWHESNEYRIAPEPETRRFTNRELAKWCADNKGQYKVESGICYTSYSYSGGDTAEVPKGVRIREWDSEEWHEPFVEVKK